MHEKREFDNKDYLRKKINTVKKMANVNIVSRQFGIKGTVDEVHFLESGDIAPLDYKYAVYENVIYKTYKFQLCMYAIMLEEVFEKPVNKGFLVFCRSGNELVEVGIEHKDKEEVLEIIAGYNDVLNGFYPDVTENKAKCLECSYKNLCVK